MNTAAVFSASHLDIDCETVIKAVSKTLGEAVIECFKKRDCVVGLSGGKDSSVVAALCVGAVGKERVLGLYWSTM